MNLATAARDVQCVQLFLPLRSPGEAQANGLLIDVRKELADRFGGVSCFVQSPVQGLWENPQGDLERDELVIFEVMTEVLDPEWWAYYRRDLEKRFAQKAVLIRGFAAHVL